ncbi:MAG: ATP synthase F1 subunit delta [Candidatus Moranbacteria bacterium]|nr:ATP synthase F1 subunit delta [Candidatus Moranbacteria bacterium]
MKVSATQYAKTLFELTENKSQEDVLAIVKKFSEQLKKDGQLKNAGKIMEKFGEIYNAKNGIVEARVTSARKLEEVQLENIAAFIKEKYSAKAVEIENIVDEKIKGGIVIKVGDEVLDASVENQLKKLKNILSK